jgi:hypothetical protein
VSASPRLAREGGEAQSNLKRSTYQSEGRRSTS